jgi:transketolase
MRGGYVLADPTGDTIDLILIATGSELALAVAARDKLSTGNTRARVVSLPSWELFDEQPQEYRDAVLPPHVDKRLAIEAGSPQGWHRYVGMHGDILGVEQFGASAPGEMVLREFGFTVENICQRALRLLSGEKE